MFPNSVERTTMIELFSTFFDRLVLNHASRDVMLKQLYQFKTHLYSNDSMKTYFEELQHFAVQHRPPAAVEQKSPSRREVSQTRQRSLRKDDQPDVLKSRHAKPLTDRTIIVVTSCHHEFERTAFENYLLSNNNEVVKCPQCQQVLPAIDYEHLLPPARPAPPAPHPFEELKNKTNFVLRSVHAAEKNSEEFLALLNDTEDQNKQRCFSGAVEYYREQSPRKNHPQLPTQVLSNLSSIGYSRLGEDKPMTLSNQANLSLLKKCLRCNKDVANKENKPQSSYFCLACRNL